MSVTDTVGQLRPERWNEFRSSMPMACNHQQMRIRGENTQGTQRELEFIATIGAF